MLAYHISTSRKFLPRLLEILHVWLEKNNKLGLSCAKLRDNKAGLSLARLREAKLG